MPKEGKKLTQDDLDRFPAEQISSIKEFEIGLDNGEYFASNYVFKVTVKEGKVTHYWDTPKEERIAEQRKDEENKKQKQKQKQQKKQSRAFGYLIVDKKLAVIYENGNAYIYKVSQEFINKYL